MFSGFRQLSSKASYKPVNCWIYSKVSLCIIYAETHFASPTSFQLQKPWRTFVLHQSSAAAQCGKQWSRFMALHSVERDRTGHHSSVNKLQELPVQGQAVKTLAVHCHSDVCSAAGGHSAGCRKSWFCLQRYTILVTSNGVTICGSKFAPTVSKHCQHQHSAIPKTTPATCNSNHPSCCDIQDTISSVHHHDSFVHSHCGL